MSGPGRPAFEPPEGCWSSIGVSGDRSCPELAAVVHCRNCPVLGRAAGALFDRPLPPGYAREWRDVVAQPPAPAPASTSVVVFRLGREWLALDATLFAEVADARPVRRVAHRTHTLLAGIVNIRGKLELCVSLAGLLGIARAPSRAQAREGAPAPLGRRLAVVRSEGETWAFEVDEVHGVHRFPTASLISLPATLPAGVASLTRGIFPMGDLRVVYLDGARLGAAMRGALA